MIELTGLQLSLLIAFVIVCCHLSQGFRDYLKRQRELKEKVERIKQHQKDMKL